MAPSSRRPAPAAPRRLDVGAMAVAVSAETATEPGGRVASVSLLVAVALASADASVVALALPDLYREYEASVVAISWVLTAYAVVVAAAAALLAPLHRRWPARGVLLVGLAVFALASLACGVAPSLGVLVAGRAVQGLGAALLLAAAVPALVGLAGDGARGRQWWHRAGAVGAAVGPALGGLLTQLLHWRAIFLVQAPVVAVAVVLVAAGLPERRVRVEAERAAAPGEGERLAWASAALVLLFGALVGALFLAVLLLVVVWGYAPLTGAVVVSALPAGMVVARLCGPAPPLARALGGVALLAGGLTALALLDGEQPVVAALALALCGGGFDLLVELVAPPSTPAGRPPLWTGAVSVGARHWGLVLGLVLAAPILSSALDAATDRAVLNGVGAMLDARLNTRDKLEVAWALRAEIDETPRGEVPDVEGVFAEHGADDDNALGAASDAVTDAITTTLTRAFRPAYLVSALLGLLVAVPAVGLVRRDVRRRRIAADEPERRARAASLALGGSFVAAGALLGGQLVAGAVSAGEHHAADPCTADAQAYEGGGIDGVVQRIALGAINGAACELGTSRERMLLSLDPDSGFADVAWDRATAEDALRAGAERAIEDADERGSLPGWAASALRAVVRRAPMGWLADQLPIPGL